jgi:predicted dehydrogenase
MARQNRRSFLKRASAASAGAATFAWTGAINAAGANERITLGLIGCGGRGPGLAQAHGAVHFVCDADQKRLAQAAKRFDVKPQNAVTDMRRLFDDKSLDAVFIATPDHWHAPAGILACEAGKHVYVEKPCSHNLRESRLLLDAGRRNKVVVQHGTQSRGSTWFAQAMQMLREGIIGDVLSAKAWNIQRRPSIGRGTPSDPPPGVDYEMWVGPAEFMPYQKNRFHYAWHWWYNFGTGDIGNDGAHEIDYALWGLGVQTLPTRVVALGGKYFHDDDQEFPDTATCVCEYPGDGNVGSRRQLIFEMRLWSTNYPYNVDSGAEFYGTSGRMFISKRGKLEVFGERNQRVEVAKPEEEPPTPVSFLDAIRSGERPCADIAIAHRSVAVIHLFNIAVRLGRSLEIDPGQERIVDDDEANRLLSRPYRREGHWAVPKGVAV